MMKKVSFTANHKKKGLSRSLMLAILLLNLFSSLIDYFFVQSNINMRAKRAKIK